ncbi:MAG: hypothetical protein ACOH16_01920 [Propionibacteriaceae bacterium]
MSVAEVGVGRRDLTRSWVSLLGYLLSFFAAFLVGEGLATLFGYDSGTAVARPPVWVMLASTIPALVVFAIPGILAWFFGRRAVRAGDRRGNIPAWIGLVIALLFVATNVLAAFVPGM